jgi:biotin operon repressor/gas vesicle protein
MTAIALNISYHARVPAELIRDVKKPRALQILNHLLTLCSPQNPEVWIDQADLGKKLGLHRDTVGRWIRYLEDIGRLVCQGVKKGRRVKTYRIALFRNEQEQKARNITSDKIDGLYPAKGSDYVRSFCRTINKEEETEFKEQTIELFFKKNFSENKKISLKQKLKFFGITHVKAEKLIGNGSTNELKIVEAQLQHLCFLMQKGKPIENPAGWLSEAIRKNYALPEEIDAQVIEERKRSENLREALRIAQDASFAKNKGDYEKAKELATKSLLVADNKTAKEVLCECKEQSKRIERLLSIKASLSNEQRTLIYKQAQDKQIQIFRKFGRSEKEIRQTKFFTEAVKSEFEKMLLAGI